MKKFSSFLNEAQRSFASQEAEKLKLTHVGYGKYADVRGNVTHMSKQGKLVKLAPQEQGGQKQGGQEEEGGSETKVDQGAISLTFGRFNPPTTGHEALIKKVAAQKGDYRIYPSRSVDPKKNPLDTGTKIKFMKQSYPKHSDNIINNEEMKTIFDVLTTIAGEGYSEVNIVVGGDRVSEFNSLATKYNGKLYDFKKINVVSAGDRDPDADGVEGMSASKMRKAVVDDDYEAFRKGTPSNLDDGDTTALFNAVRSGMKVKKGAKGKTWTGSAANEMWEIAPRDNQKTLREHYINKDIFNVGDLVESLNTGLVGRIIRRGTSYLICVTENNVMFKSWIKDLTEAVIPAHKTGIYGVSGEKREIGTDSLTSYAQSMVPGQERIINFINKYRKNK